MKGSFVGAVAALVSVGAGIYLLTSESASAQTTVFDALMHGIGAYLIARGLWMIAELMSREPSKEKKPAVAILRQPFAPEEPPSNPHFVP